MANTKVVLRDDAFDASNYLKRRLDDIKSYAAMHDQLEKFIKSNLVEGVDYGQTDPRSKKATLKQPGAEKVGIMFGLTPVFFPDKETWKMANADEHIICYVCYLLTPRSKREAADQICKYGIEFAHYVLPMYAVAEGRGAGDIHERSNATVNDIVKRTQKRAYVDAILRVGGLHERFTQHPDDGDWGTTEDLSPTQTETIVHKKNTVKGNEDAFKVDEESGALPKVDKKSTEKDNVDTDTTSANPFLDYDD